MKKAVLLILVTFLLTLNNGFADSESDVTSELDAYWTELSRTVKEGDFDAYAAGYHPDAVLANMGKGVSYPISTALAGWKQGFMDTKAGKMKASVEFRFSQRLNDESTAHETGIFRYASQAGDGEEVVAFMAFEGLMVKKDRWLMLMEYQKNEVSEEDWNALNQDHR